MIPCEKSEKKITEFFLDFGLEKFKVLVILGIKVMFFFGGGDFLPVYLIVKEI